jgi:hypothetical protein
MPVIDRHFPWAADLDRLHGSGRRPRPGVDVTPTPRESAAPHGVGYGRSGDGPVLVLVHSSVSGRRQ